MRFRHSADMKRNAKLARLLPADVTESELFKQAITHRSAGGSNNERLEFLGDSVLGLTISEYLFRQAPDADEGDLSRLRASLVRGESLAEIGLALDLGDSLRLGPGELKSGGFRRKSILEDALEAIIGAVYLLKGLEFTRGFIHSLFARQLDNLPDPETLKDPKSRLQEWLQSRGYDVPAYQVLSTSGQAHNRRFVAECRIPALKLVCQHEGASRRKAEQGAAEQALQKILESDV